jgi:hypothetical protein
MSTMAGYTKLFNSILASTIWREGKETKILWITMLAMADKDGMVEASVPGLADMARLSVKETQAALGILESPDEFSRTKDHEGRRIEPVLGGWLILNHATYRQKMDMDERSEYLRLKKQESRDRARQQLSTKSTQAESREQRADPEALYVDPHFNLFWAAYPRKVAKGDAWKSWLKVKTRPPLQALLDAIAVQKPGLAKDGFKYAPYPATWLNDRRWEDCPEPCETSTQEGGGF